MNISIVRRVLGNKTPIAYRESKRGGLEVTHENWGWFFTHRTWGEVGRMHPTLEPAPAKPASQEEQERECFGETVDEPIPDDLGEMFRA
jgi:hypothetical protein